MKLMIPPLGARIRLTADWSFDLHYEHRNDGVFELFGAFTSLKGTHGYAQDTYPPSHRVGEADKEPVRVTLSAGTLLTIDRYYIRNNAGEFDSVTFSLPSQPLPGYSFGKKRASRFWAKLEDVNEIEFEFLAEDQPWWHGVKDQLRAGQTVRVKTDYAFLYNRAEVELRPLTAKKRDELPATVEFFVIAEGSRVAFVRPEAEDLDAYPEEVFLGRRNSSTSKWTPTFAVSSVIGYVVKS